MPDFDPDATAKHMADMMGVRLEAMEREVIARIDGLCERLDRAQAHHDETRSKVHSLGERVHAIELTLASKAGDGERLRSVEEKIGALRSEGTESRVKLGMLYAAIGAGGTAIVGIGAKLLFGGHGQ